MNILLCALLALHLGTQSGAQANSLDASIEARLALHVTQAKGRWIEFRHDLHRHPELSGKEQRTANELAQELERIGLEVRRGVGGHGLVAVLQGSGPGRTIGFRADMDAVPSNATDPVDYRSTIPGVRHLCGHDVHATIGLALAETLQALRHHWSGTLVFYFQPAEESARGAKAMIQDGALSDPLPEECYAFHTAPLPVGSIGVTPGRALAMRDGLRLTLSGSGDLQAAGNRLRALVQALSTLDNPSSAPSQEHGFLVAHLNSTTGGSNPEELQLSASITLTSDAERTRGHDQLRRAIEALNLNNVEIETLWIPKNIAGVFNDPKLVQASAALMRLQLGPGRYLVDHKVPVQFSEDFGSFQELSPGTMYWLGVSNPNLGTVGAPHSPSYVADDGAIAVGVRCMAALLLQRLAAR